MPRRGECQRWYSRLMRGILVNCGKAVCQRRRPGSNEFAPDPRPRATDKRGGLLLPKLAVLVGIDAGDTFAGYREMFRKTGFRGRSHPLAPLRNGCDLRKMSRAECIHSPTTRRKGSRSFGTEGRPDDDQDGRSSEALLRRPVLQGISMRVG